MIRGRAVGKKGKNMEIMLERIEKELEVLREQNKVNDFLDSNDDFYRLGVNSGICKALSLVYKIHIEFIDK